jgi:SAM-dependent methyltransferase
MHAAAQPANRAEGLGLRVQPTLARCERLPLAAASCDAAWSQDALCHMDKPPVIAEVARVLRPGATFAFSDWIARAPLTAEELAALRDLWAFPSLLRLPEYVALLDAAGFDILYVEDTTAGTYGAGSSAPADQELWLHAFIQDFGEAELDRQRQRSDHWRTLVESGRTGNARFIARRRAPD